MSSNKNDHPIRLQATFAALKGDLAKLKELYATHKDDLEKPDDSSSTLMHNACAGGHVDVIEWLISKGFDLNPINEFGASPLFEATYRENNDVVKLLRSRGAILKVPKANIRAALYILGIGGISLIIMIIVLFCGDFSGKWLLMLVLFNLTLVGIIEGVKGLMGKQNIHNQNTDFKLLRSHDAILIIVPSVGAMIIMITVLFCGDFSGEWILVLMLFNLILAVILKGVIVLMEKQNIHNLNTQEKQVSLRTNNESIRFQAKQAISLGELSQLKELYNEHKDELRKPDDFGLTLLHYACIVGNVQVVEWLIGKGFDINVVNQFGASPLFEATYRENNDVAKLLRSRDAILKVPEANIGAALYTLGISGISLIIMIIVFFCGDFSGKWLLMLVLFNLTLVGIIEGVKGLMGKQNIHN